MRTVRHCLKSARAISLMSRRGVGLAARVAVCCSASGLVAIAPASAAPATRIGLPAGSFGAVARLVRPTRTAVARGEQAPCALGEVARTVEERTTTVVTSVVGGRLDRRRVVEVVQATVCASAFAPTSAPGTAYWLHGVPGTYGNTGAGAVADCTVAAAADLEQIFTRSPEPLAPGPWIAAYDALLAAEQPGVSPGPSAGLAVAPVLATWAGPGIAGTRIASARALGLGQASIERALRAGPLYGVVDLPAPTDPGVAPLVDTSYVALTQWTPADPGSSYLSGGLHAVAVVGFDASSVFLESWGYVQPVSWSWWAAHAEQADAITP
jgi:hypothetical protein